jgi:hypothetical protein
VKVYFLLLLPAILAGDPVPRIGSIDYYGLRKVSEGRIQKALGVKAGDHLPPSKGNLEETLEQIPGVVVARVEAVCCDGDRSMLFIGIEEKGAPHFELHRPPDGDVTLPPDVAEPYNQLVEALEIAAGRGSTAEDLTHGHPLAADPDARDLQLRLVELVPKQLARIREVLRNAEDPEQRAMAATLIGYASLKSAVVNDLEYAMQDPEESVRGAAMNSLNAIAVLAVKKPELAIHISPTWFVEMLNSVAWSDRVKASKALVNLTDARPATTLDLLRERALPSLSEMAQWNSLPYALPPFLLLGRVAGLNEKQIQDRWTAGNHAKTVRDLLKTIGKKRR